MWFFVLIICFLSNQLSLSYLLISTLLGELDFIYNCRKWILVFTFISITLQYARCCWFLAFFNAGPFLFFALVGEFLILELSYFATLYVLVVNDYSCSLFIEFYLSLISFLYSIFFSVVFFLVTIVANLWGYLNFVSGPLFILFTILLL